MSKKILIDAVYPGETRVVIYDKNRIQDFDYENIHKFASQHRIDSHYYNEI